MTSIQDKAKQSEAIARASIGRLSNERLAETWMATNDQPDTRELTITRSWLMDELEQRMGRMDVWADTFPNAVRDYDGDRFGAWLAAEFAANGEPVNPLTYLS